MCLRTSFDFSVGAEGRKGEGGDDTDDGGDQDDQQTLTWKVVKMR